MAPVSRLPALRLLAALALGLPVLAVLADPSAPPPPVHVISAWIRWLPAGLPAAGYLTLANTGAKPIELESATSPSYGDVSIHRSIKQGTTEEMVPVQEITLQPHRTLAFESTGYHFMLTKPAPSADTSATIPITLRFADGSSMMVRFEVRKNSQPGSATQRH
jgi:copper(I)-binding protein